MFKKILATAALLPLVLGTTAVAQEEPAAEDIFLEAERYKFSNDDAYNGMVTEVFKGDIGEREVYNSPAPVRAGTVVEDVMGNKFDAPATDAWVYFVDEVPAANWGHPAKIVYVDAMNGEPSAADCQFPLKMLPAFNGITEGAVNEIARIKEFEWREKVLVPVVESYPFGGKSKYNKYHVLISGGASASSNNPRYLNDLKFIHHTLLNKYLGNTHDNIYVIYADGNGDLDGDGNDDVDYAATKANVDGVFNMLADNLSENDILFVYVTNHGGYESGQDVFFCLYYGQRIRDDEFAGLINNIQAGQMKFVFEQCYSGGMIDDLAGLSGKNLSVATASDYNEPSYGAQVPPGWDSAGTGYDEFVYWWTAAMFGGYPPSSLPGTHPTGSTAPDPKTADVNNDKKVTMKEAFDFAKTNDRWPAEHPQYYSSPAAADSWTLCKTEDCGCGSTTKAEGATFFGLFFATYAVILLRRKSKS